MIQRIILKGNYKFEGNLDDLKFCISSLKIITTVKDLVYDGYKFYNVICRFKYKGEHHKIEIIGDMVNHNILYIYYRGTLGG